MNKLPLGTMPDRRVAQVLAVLKTAIGRDRVRIDVIEQAIRSLDAKQRSNPDLLGFPPFAQSNDDKRIALRHAKTFAKLEQHLAKLKERRDEWDVLVRATYDYDDRESFSKWLDQLKRWRKQLEGFAGKGSEELGMFSDESKPFASKALKHAAALAAAEIMTGHGLRLTVTKKSSTQEGSVGSVFVQIANILANGENCTYECRVLRDRLKEKEATAKRKEKREIG